MNFCYVVPTSSPVGLSVIVLNSTDVQISWNAPPVSEQNGIIIQYNVSVTDANTDDMHSLITSSNDVIVGELLPYTAYHCAVSAHTSVGSGPFSSLVYFETDEAGNKVHLIFGIDCPFLLAPSAPPEDITIDDVTSTEISISWSEPLEDYTNGIIRSYNVSAIEVETGTTITEKTLNTELTLSSLHPHYHYQVSVAAVTVESGPYSSPLSVITDEACKLQYELSFIVLFLVVYM